VKLKSDKGRRSQKATRALA